MSRENAAQQATRPAQPDALPRFAFEGTKSQGDVRGEEVYGVVQRVVFGAGRTKDVDLIEVVDETHGEITVFLSSTGLNQALVQGGNNLGRPVEKGDTAYIRFDGVEDLDNNKTFNHFAVHLEAGDPRAAAAKAAAPSGSHAPADDDEELPF